MIFKTFNNDIDSSIYKIGIFGKSFGEVIDRINDRKADIDGLVLTKGIDEKEAKKQVGSIWSYLAKDEDKDKLVEEFNDFKDIVTDTGLTAKEAADILGEDLSPEIRSYVKTSKDGKISTEGFRASIGNLSIGAKAGQVALKGLALAGNMLLAFAATEAISLLVTKISNYAHELENARDAAEDAKSTLNELNTSVSDNGKWISENASKYERLADGVDSLGRNVSLTDDEFEEYNSLTNEIANMFPTLVTGYTDTGDAILACKNNVDLLTQAYKDQKQAAQDAVLQKADDLWSGFKADTTDWNVFSNGGMSKETERSILQDMIDGKDLSSFDWNTIATVLNNAEVKVNSWFGGSDKNTKKIIEENKKTLYAYVRTLDATMESATSNITPIIDAYLDSNKDFSKYDKDVQAQIKQVADNMGYKFYSQFENQTDLVDWIDNTLVPAFKDAKSQNLLDQLFSLDIDDMSVNDYVTQINILIEKIAQAIGGDPDEIKIKLGFDFVDSDEELLNKAKKKVDNAFSTNSPRSGSANITKESFESDNKKDLDDWLDTLNESDLQLILDGEVEFDEKTTVASAQKALDAARKRVSENPIDGNLSFTDTIAQVQALSDGLDQLDKIYADVYDKEDFDWSSILNNDNFKEQFGELGDAYDDFIKTVSNSPSDLSACQNAFNNLATAYINGSGILDNLTEETKAATIAQLQQMGISNAEEVVTKALALQTDYLATSKAFLANTGKDLADATWEEISAFMDEANYSDEARASLANLLLAKQTCNGTSLDFSGDISNIYNYVKILGGATNALKALYDAKNGKFSSSAMGGKEAHDALVKMAEQEVQDALDNAANYSTKVNYGGGSSYKSAVDKANKASKDSSSASEPTVETFDFIETAVKRCEERIDSFKTTAENTYKSLSTRTKAYADLINETTNEINLQQQAYSSYMAKANSFGLGEEWASQVRNGSINIADVTDDVLKQQIKNYQTYYEKAKSALDTVADLRTELIKLKTEKIQLEIDVKGNKLDTLESQLDKIQNRMDLKESWGFTASAGDYRNLNSNLKKQVANLTSQNSLIKSQQSLVKKGSEQWYEYKKAIDDNNASIQDLTKSMAENATSMSEIANNKASTKVDKLDSSDELLKAKGENESYYKKQNSLINSEIKNIKKRQSAYNKAVSTNKSSLSSSIKSIKKTKGNKSLMKQIKSYTKSKKEIPSSLLNKALSLKDNGTLYEKLVRYNAYLTAYETSVETAKLYKQTSASDKADLVKQKSDNIATYYSNKQTKYTQRAQEINDVISIIEESGYKATKEYYKKLLSLEKSNNKTLVAEKEKLVSQLQSGIKDGSIEINSDDYYELVSQINDVTNAINESTLSMTQFQNQIRQVSWDNFDALRDRISDFTSEVDFLINELSREDLTDSDTGKLTENGRAVRGLYASNYTTYTAQAKAYANEIKSINKELASDPYNETLIDRKKELVEAYQNAISSAQEEKYAILDLQEQAYNSLIDKIGDLISEYEDLLDTQKNAYEYQQKMNDLAEERASIQKQLQAYAGDMSEENRARIQQLNVQLKDSEKSIQEAQYDKFISDTKDMLSDLQDDLTDAVQDIIDELSKNFDELIAEIKSDSTITSTISDKMDEIGYIGTDELKTVLNGSDIVSTTKTAITAIEKLQKAIEEYSSQIASAVTSNDNSVLSSLQNASLSKIEKDASKAEENANDYKNDRDSIKRSMAEKQSEITDWKSKKAKQKKTVSSAYKSYKNALSKYGKKSSKTEKAKQNYEKQKVILEDINNNLKYVSDEYDALSKRYSKANSNYKKENAKYKALNYLAEHLSSGTDSYDSYSDINKKLFSKYSGMVLSTSEMKELAEILGVKYDNANSSGNLYKKLKSIKVPGFKVGSKYIPEDMLAMLGEEGTELQFDADKGVLRQVGEGDKIFTKEMSERLWELAANPNLMSMNFKPVIPNIPTNMNSSTDSSTNVVINELTLPNVKNYEEFRTDLIKDSKFESAVQDMTINKITGRSSSLSKLKYTK